MIKRYIELSLQLLKVSNLTSIVSSSPKARIFTLLGEIDLLQIWRHSFVGQVSSRCGSTSEGFNLASIVSSNPKARHIVSWQLLWIDLLQTRRLVGQVSTRCGSKDEIKLNVSSLRESIEFQLSEQTGITLIYIQVWCTYTLAQDIVEMLHRKNQTNVSSLRESIEFQPSEQTGITLICIQVTGVRTL